jgi:flagellar protein FliS
MSTNTAAPQAYRESAILTAPPERLVVMLYDGARRFLFQAAAAMREGDVQIAHNRLTRAEAIIAELTSTLDLSQGEIAERLQAIYLFCRRHLTEARLEQSAEKVDTVRRLLSDLRESWAGLCGS